MSSFFSSSNVFLIVVLLVPPPFIFTIAISVRTGPLRSTFLMLFLLKWFFIYFDQFLQQNLYVPMAVITPQDWCFIRWRLLLNGFRSVLVWLQPTNFQTENLICVHQELGSERPSDLYNRFQGELLHYKSLPQPWIWCFRFERFLLYLYSQTRTQCRLYVVNTFSERFS